MQHLPLPQWHNLHQPISNLYDPEVAGSNPSWIQIPGVPVTPFRLCLHSPAGGNS